MKKLKYLVISKIQDIKTTTSTEIEHFKYVITTQF